MSPSLYVFVQTNPNHSKTSRLLADDNDDDNDKGDDDDGDDNDKGDDDDDEMSDG